MTRRDRWHVLRDTDGTVTLARRLPPRFDLSVEHSFPPVARPLVLAHEIRKDLWRALQSLRGFAPVVRVAPLPDGVTVRAGGALAGARGAAAAHGPVQARIAELLDRPDLRRRWIRHAGGRA